MSDVYHGSCLCGAVKFEIDEFLSGIAHCHCSMCRKFHGADYATIASVAPDKFRWRQGETALKDYVADNGTTRTFCRHCGSSLRFASPGSGDGVEIALGTLDSDIPVCADAHIFVGSAANWSVLMDDLPQYSEGRSSERIKHSDGQSKKFPDPGPQAVNESTRKLLFVCVENSNRSQMAQAFATLQGGGRVEAFSAGSRPSGVVNPKAIAAMAELGYDLGAHTSSSLDDLPDIEFDFVATMGCGDACPHVRARARADWQIPDPREMAPEDFRKVRDLIKTQVKSALDDLL